ncbi:MAG: tRNA (N(6)-L-threonylcarbamoyladenosine(37)-C(2))-methylthiotransferase MtaB [Clostridia bacterium]|nr:tRNA (N(6)-L-threonylcarbamoyladenosine(37)-C(2))-methylthiotransferase MtaB [Clostridia bacterium]
MKAAIITLGCKVNHYESEGISKRLEQEGYEIVDSSEEADVYIINSCTVTAESDRKTRQAVRKMKRLHPGSTVLLTGCMPQAFPEDAKRLEQADIVTGNKFNSRIPELLEKHIKGQREFAVEEHRQGEQFAGDAVSSYRERTRATLKIEDGCNRFCSYCIIPYARGRVRSKPLDEIEKEADAFAENGYKEIVLVGINLSAYGTDNGSDMAQAVKIAAKPEGIKRVRLGSLEPDHITDGIIEKLKEIPGFCPQFHISLQSGCDKTLKKMNRHYNTDEYRTLCKKLREVFADCTITTDLMTGFPGETQEDFEKSLDFVREIGFEKVHVFPYSKREGTPAAKMAEQVEKAEKERRAKRVIEEAEKIRQEFLKKQKGKTVAVLPEEYSKGFCHGYTANYTPVTVNCPPEKCGEIINVKITGVEGDYCTGEII